MESKSFNTGKAELLFVEVPKDSMDFSIHDDTMMNHLVYNSMSFTEKGYVVIPDEEYDILGITTELNEYACSEIVDSKMQKGAEYNNQLGHYQSGSWVTYYKNYLHQEPSICIPNTARESFNSICSKIGLEKNKVYVVLKKRS